jgi:hypothetical protein
MLIGIRATPKARFDSSRVILYANGTMIRFRRVN